MSWTARTTSTLTLLLCLTAAGCSDSPAANAGTCEGGVIADGSSFDLLVSGAANATACGIAASGEGSGGESWGVQLLSTTDITNISIYTELLGRPGPGTYAIVDFTATDGSPSSGSYVVLAIFDEGSLDNTYSSVTGELTILASSVDEVSGTFEFTAREGTEGTTVVTMSGSFTSNNEDA